MSSILYKKLHNYTKEISSILYKEIAIFQYKGSTNVLLMEIKQPLVVLEMSVKCALHGTRWIKQILWEILSCTVAKGISNYPVKGYMVISGFICHNELQGQKLSKLLIICMRTCKFY